METLCSVCGKAGYLLNPSCMECECSLHCSLEVCRATELHKLVQERLGRTQPKLAVKKTSQPLGYNLNSISIKLYHWIISLRKFDMNIILVAVIFFL